MNSSSDLKKSKGKSSSRKSIGYQPSLKSLGLGKKSYSTIISDKANPNNSNNSNGSNVFKSSVLKSRTSPNSPKSKVSLHSKGLLLNRQASSQLRNKNNDKYNDSNNNNNNISNDNNNNNNRNVNDNYSNNYSNYNNNRNSSDIYSNSNNNSNYNRDEFLRLRRLLDDETKKSDNLAYRNEELQQKLNDAKGGLLQAQCSLQELKTQTDHLSAMHYSKEKSLLEQNKEYQIKIADLESKVADSNRHLRKDEVVSLLQDQLKASQELANKLQEEMSKLRVKVSLAEVDVGELNKKIHLNDLQHNKEKDDIKVNLTNEINKLEARIRMMNEKIYTSNLNEESASQNLRELRNKMHELKISEQRQSDLEAAIRDANLRSSAYETNCQNLEIANKQLDLKAKQYEQELQASASEMSSLYRTVKQNEEMILTLAQQKSLLSTEVVQLKNTLVNYEDTSDRYTELKEETKRKKRELEKCNSRIDIQTHTIEDLERQILLLSEEKLRVDSRCQAANARASTAVACETESRQLLVLANQRIVEMHTTVNDLTSKCLKYFKKDSSRDGLLMLEYLPAISTNAPVINMPPPLDLNAMMMQSMQQTPSRDQHHHHHQQQQQHLQSSSSGMSTYKTSYMNSDGNDAYMHSYPLNKKSSSRKDINTGRSLMSDNTTVPITPTPPPTSKSPGKSTSFFHSMKGLFTSKEAVVTETDSSDRYEQSVGDRKGSSMSSRKNRVGPPSPDNSYVNDGSSGNDSSSGNDNSNSDSSNSNDNTIHSNKMRDLFGLPVECV